MQTKNKHQELYRGCTCGCISRNGSDTKEQAFPSWTKTKCPLQQSSKTTRVLSKEQKMAETLAQREPNTSTYHFRCDR